MFSKRASAVIAPEALNVDLLDYIDSMELFTFPA